MVFYVGATAHECYRLANAGDAPRSADPESSAKTPPFLSFLPFLPLLRLSRGGLAWPRFWPLFAHPFFGGEGTLRFRGINVEHPNQAARG